MDDHVLATFTRPDEAEAAARRVRQELGYEARVGDTEDQLDALTLGQQSEMNDSGPAFSSGVMSGPFARGALTWGLAGTVIGAVLAAPIGLVIEAGDWPRWLLVVFAAVVGGFAAGAVGLVLGGGRQAVKEGGTVPEDPTAVVRVDSPPERADDVLRFVVAAGARTARYVEGPVNRRPSSEVERPRSIRADAAEETGPGSDYNAGFGTDVR